MTGIEEKESRTPRNRLGFEWFFYPSPRRGEGGERRSREPGEGRANLDREGSVLSPPALRADRSVGTGAAILSPILCLLILAAGVLIPIVAHGCHGDEVDHEPGSGPPRLTSPN